MKRERDPTPEEFEKLLAWLDPDSDEAGHKLNLIHTRLIKVFAARGCVDAESLADEVVNRVAVRIDTVIMNYTDPLRCCLGFVENVYREYMRDLQKRLTFKEPPPPRPSDELEQEDTCLEQCLESLTSPERDLFERYFHGEKRARINARKSLAAALQLTANALRIRAHHVRKEMHLCLVKCISQS
jgi:DNA-directed RNA polymerase specialized sigma24 family protein